MPFLNDCVIQQEVNCKRQISLRFFLRTACIGRLDIDLFAAQGRNKIALSCHLCEFSDGSPFSGVNNIHIYRATTKDQFVVNDVFHDIGHFLLPETDAGVSKPDVLAVVFIGVVKIAFPLTSQRLHSLNRKASVK